MTTRDREWRKHQKIYYQIWSCDFSPKSSTKCSCISIHTVLAKYCMNSLLVTSVLHTDCSSGSGAYWWSKHQPSPIKPIRCESCSCNCLLSTCRSMINRRLLWKQRCICFYFTGYYTFTNFYFVSSCWTILGLVLWYTAFPPSAGFLTEKCAYVCVCYVPKGENHLQAVLSDLRSQWECMPAVYGDRAWPQLKT